MALMMNYFKYEINTSSEVIEPLRIPIEAMDINCYIETRDNNVESHDILMKKFIKTLHDTEII